MFFWLRLYFTQVREKYLDTMTNQRGRKPPLNQRRMMMTTVFFVKNDFDDDTLSAAGTWVNDGRDPMYTEAEAKERLADWLRKNPSDAVCVFIDTYEVEA